MFKKTLAAFSTALLLGGTLASPGVAQTAGSTISMGSGQARSEQSTDRPGARTGEESQNRQRQRPAPPAAAPDPAVIMAEAQAVLTAAGNACTATEAAFLGADPQQQKVYEVACAAGTGPGYVMVAKTPPAAPELIDCVQLAGQAETARARDPAAVVQTCRLPGNQNPMNIIMAYAAQAGVTCTIDQASSIGRSSTGEAVYEVGCNGSDGYWVERGTASEPWTKTECVQIISQNATCRYTTMAEIAAGFKTRLAGTAASDCDVTQVRFMGSNNNGSFYEAKCAAEGTGYIARSNAQGAIQQVYACATAQRIGGGCTLTTVAAAAPAPTSE